MMNTEILDYIKALSKTEFFYIEAADMLFSLTIVICGVISLKTGTTTLLYTIMFACATALLGCNAYKCFRRGSKNGWVFAVLGVVFATVTGMCIYALIGGF